MPLICILRWLAFMQEKCILHFCYLRRCCYCLLHKSSPFKAKGVIICTSLYWKNILVMCLSEPNSSTYRHNADADLFPTSSQCMHKYTVYYAMKGNGRSACRPFSHLSRVESAISRSASPRQVFLDQVEGDMEENIPYSWYQPESDMGEAKIVLSSVL